VLLMQPLQSLVLLVQLLMIRARWMGSKWQGQQQQMVVLWVVVAKHVAVLHAL
jgi:hypothetical protein